ncbi:hypothetical protein NKH71_31640 [Mesorhizobium sp. M0983]|uniref:hypothetical protein n=1 Tax=Mesorhizobium sp. M0983 TaxID=2957040 RepID=UPI003338158B
MFRVDLPTNQQKVVQRYIPDHSAQNDEDERLSVLLSFVPTDVDAAIGLMSLSMPPTIMAQDDLSPLKMQGAMMFFIPGDSRIALLRRKAGKML